MKDITPDLLKTIQDDFKSRFEANKKIMFLYDKIKNKNASYRDANEFAIEVGECLERALGVISATTYQMGECIIISQKEF